MSVFDKACLVSLKCKNRPNVDGYACPFNMAVITMRAIKPWALLYTVFEACYKDLIPFDGEPVCMYALKDIWMRKWCLHCLAD